jgi:predicted amidohydrolase YtcJ
MADMQEPSFFPAQEPGQDLLAELEETIPQGVPNDTGFRRRADDPVEEVDVLDALMAESVERLEAERQYKADREAARKGFAGMSKEEVDFCNSRLRAFEMAREWDADRCIAVFVQYVCEKCDTGQTIFSRLMEHHQHRRNPKTHRWVTVKDSKLELETVFDQKTVPMCVNCVDELGLEDPTAEDIPWLEDVLDGND